MYPPFYNANNYLCNNIYDRSGKCNINLKTDLVTYYDDDDSMSNVNSESSQIQCSFIESIRYGTYDVNGDIYLTSSQHSSQQSHVTVSQKVLLTMLTTFCVAAVVYSCYVHHQLTNLLLKSLGTGKVVTKSRRRHMSRNRSDVTDGSDETGTYYA